MNLEEKNPVAFAVKLISFFYFLGVAFFIFTSGLVFFDSNLFFKYLGSLGVSFSFLNSSLIIFGIIFLALAIADFFIAVGIFKGKIWAGYSAIAFSIIGTLAAIPLIYENKFLALIPFAINSFVWISLFFSETVKDSFGNDEDEETKISKEFPRSPIVLHKNLVEKKSNP